MSRPFSSPRPTRRSRFRPTVDRLEGRALMAYAGSLDPSFGTGAGYLLKPVAAAFGTGFDDLNLIKVQSDGSIVAAGPIGYNGGQGFGVVKLKPDGTLDSSFGRGGETDVPLPFGLVPTGDPTSLLFQTDGKILVVGQAPAAGGVDVVAMRFDADGSLDASYGTAGIALVYHEGQGNFSEATLQLDNKLVVVGDTVFSTSTQVFQQITAIRLTTTGMVDFMLFGDSGVANFSGLAPGDTTGYQDTVTGVAVQPNGQVVIAADIATPSLIYPELIRLNAGGFRDDTLLQSGILGAGVPYYGPNSLVIQPDGKFLLANEFLNSFSPLLVRLNADGSLDKTLTSANFGNNKVLSGLALQPDGKIDLLSSVGNFAAIRVNADLTLDTTFGLGGLSNAPVPAPPATGVIPPVSLTAKALAVGPDNKIVLAGSNLVVSKFTTTPATSIGFARLTTTGTSAHLGDFTGDGVSDPAVYLTATGTFAIGDSSGKTAGRTVQFGAAGAGNSIPAPGNYYGTGVEDVAVYLVNEGSYAIQDPTGLTSGKLLPFGTPGAGQTIPAPGNYYNTGQDDVAVYLAASGSFAIQDPTGQTAGAIIPFGKPGVGASIPVPGDYDGSGHTELAVYVPSTATFYYRSNLTGKDVAIPFGSPGLGVSLPMPGDYDGSGRTEMAVYIPSSGTFYYRPAGGGADVAIPFGTPGVGKSIPAPGDYTGSGKTELGVYLTDPGSLAYRPANGGNDVVKQFGAPGLGQSIPVTTTALIPLPGLGSGSGYAFGVTDVSVGTGLLDLGPAKKAKSTT